MNEIQLWNAAFDFIKSFPGHAKTEAENILHAVKQASYDLKAGVEFRTNDDGMEWLDERFYINKSWTFGGTEYALSDTFWQAVENSVLICESEFFDIPKKATDGAACFDIQSADNTEIAPKNSGVVRTGLKFKIPAGYVMLVFSRSGHGFKNGVRLANSVGVIDSDYRGEVKVKLQNDGDETFSVRYGDRVAQAMLLPVPCVPMVASVVTEDTERGAGGFGSTGV